LTTQAVAYSGSQVSCRSCKRPVSVTTSGSVNVFINGQSALRMGDTFAPYVCPVCLTSSPGGTVTQGSATVFINGMPLASVDSICSDGSQVIGGSSNVFVGAEITNILDSLEKMPPPKLPERALKLRETFSKIKETKELNNTHDNEIKTPKTSLNGNLDLTQKATNKINNQSTNIIRAFVAKKYITNNVDDPFAKNKFEAELTRRLDEPNYEDHLTEYHDTPNYEHHKYLDYLKYSCKYPNQGATSLCGPAAFFYCLLRDQKELYEKAARELWATGETRINNLIIKPGKDCRNPIDDFYNTKTDIAKGYPFQKILGLDWITLASLRDGSNMFLDYDDINDPLAGITFFDLPKWFEQAGYIKVFDNIVKRVFYHASKRRIEKLNNYFAEGYRVVTLIDSDMLNGGKATPIPLKKHWIVWEGKVTDQNGTPVTEQTSNNEPVKLKAFSWGEKKDYLKSDLTLDKFLWRTFGALVFSKENL